MDGAAQSCVHSWKQWVDGPNQGNVHVVGVFFFGGGEGEGEGGLAHVCMRELHGVAAATEIQWRDAYG